jgi:hypothetical protein
MPRKKTPKKAAEELVGLVSDGTYPNAEAAVKDRPELEPGLKVVQDAARAQQPAPSGPARLER